MQNYDKEIGLRELVLQELHDIVDDLVIQSADRPKEVFSEENKYCILLTICLERCISFGMKESGFFNKRDLFEFLLKGSANGKDEYLRSDFNCVASLLLHQSGKARAWIRKTINECHLATSLYSLASDREFIRAWYEPYAIMSTNAINDLYKEIETLERLHFQFNLKDRTLDRDDLFTLPPSQYRGTHKLRRLRNEDDSDDDSALSASASAPTISADKKDKKSRRKKKRPKKEKSRRNLKVAEEGDESDTLLEFDPNKSQSPNANANDKDRDSAKKEKRKKKRRDKRRRKKKDVTDDVEAEHDDAAPEQQPTEPTEPAEDASEIEPRAIRKKSMKEWQEEQEQLQLAQSEPIASPIMLVNKSQTDTSTTTTTPGGAGQQHPPARPKSGSISERMQLKLSTVKIHMNGAAGDDGNDGDGDKKVFRVSSPSDYHATFKWNDATKDDALSPVQTLKHDADKQFPDPNSYVADEQQFLDELDAEDVVVDAADIDKLIQTAPDDEDELQLSSEPDDELEITTSMSPHHVDTIHEVAAPDEEDSAALKGIAQTQKPLYASPGTASKSSTATSSSSSTLTDGKKEEILSQNDDYMRQQQKRRTTAENAQNAKTSTETEKFAPECQTFIHFTHTANPSDPPRSSGGIDSLSMYLQGDDYFTDANQKRDARKAEQDLEAKKRRQREQDVLRGNAMPSTKSPLDQPLDSKGNHVVLPSTGIILDMTESEDDLEKVFLAQSGQCFSCGDHVGSPSMARQCYYTKRLYCALCMDGSVRSPIPSRLVSELDARKYPVSGNSKRHLDSMYDVPAVPLSKVCLPSWFVPSENEIENVAVFGHSGQERRKLEIEIGDDAEEEEVKEGMNERYYKLIKLGEYLETLSYVKEYFYNGKECGEVKGVVQRALGRRPYLLDAYATDKESFGYFLRIIDEHNGSDGLEVESGKMRSIHKKKQSKWRLYGLISIRDMNELLNKDLLTEMHLAQEAITGHIKRCKHCKKRAYGANFKFIARLQDVLQ